MNKQHDREPVLYEDGFKELVTALKTKTGKLLLPHIASQLKNVTGAEMRSVKRWLMNEQAPQGLYRIKTTFFLQALGINIVEFAGQEPSMQTIFLGLGSGLISLDEARIMMSYKTNSLVMRALRLEFKAAPQVTASANRAVAKRGNEINAHVVQKIAEIRNIPQEVRASIILSIGKAILAINPALKLFTLDLFTAEDRADLRDSTEGTGPFDLLSAALLLCSDETTPQLD